MAPSEPSTTAWISSGWVNGEPERRALEGLPSGSRRIFWLGRRPGR